MSLTPEQIEGEGALQQAARATHEQSQQAVSAVPVGIANATLALIGWTNSHGESLRCGEYFCADDDGAMPYGKLGACPFCKEAQNYCEMFYNGPGSPPSYAICCGNCGAQGPVSSGSGRGDHYGARVDAVGLWNAAAQGMETRQGGDGTAPSQDDSPVACDAPETGSATAKDDR